MSEDGLYTKHYEYAAYTISSVSLNIFLLLWTIPIGIHLIKYSIYPPDGFDKLPKPLFYFSLIFILMTILSLFLLCLIDICQITDSMALFATLSVISDTAYFLQKYLLLIVLFCRSYYIFKGTGLELAKKTLNLFIIVFCITPTILIIAVLTGPILLVEIFIILLIVGLMIGLISLFIHKLHTLYKLMTHNSERSELIKVMTKTTLLAIISIILCILVPIPAIIASAANMQSIYIYMISCFFIPLEIFINFICITLSFGYFNKHYIVMCQCCDNLCKLCWSKLLKLDISEREEIGSINNIPTFVAMMSNGQIIKHTPTVSIQKNKDNIFKLSIEDKSTDNMDYGTPTVTIISSSKRLSAIIHPYSNNTDIDDVNAMDSNVFNEDDVDEGFVIITEENKEIHTNNIMEYDGDNNNHLDLNNKYIKPTLANIESYNNAEKQLNDLMMTMFKNESKNRKNKKVEQMKENAEEEIP